MAKGDHTRVQDQINNQGNIEQQSQNALMNTLYGQNLGFGNNYNTGAATDFGSYGNISNNYNNLYNALANGQTGVGIGSNLPNQGGQWSNPMANYSGNPTDPNAEAAYVQALSQQPGADPTLASDPNYWIGKINETGGLTAGNMGYWNNRSLAGAGDSNSGGLNGALSGALGGYQNFADTGGLSTQNQEDLRARAASAVRSAFQTQQSDLNQNRSLQQFSPNYAAASAKMARDMGYGASDAMTNANASIAQLIQQGKLAGLSGMTNVGQINNAAQQANIQDMLAANSGMTGLYGSTPGLANTFGNQYLNSSGQLLQGQGLQNNIGSQQIQGQLGESNVPGDFSQVMGNIGSGLKLASGILAPFGGFGSLGNMFGSNSLDMSTLTDANPYTSSFGNGGTLTFGNSGLSSPWW